MDLVAHRRRNGFVFHQYSVHRASVSLKDGTRIGLAIVKVGSEISHDTISFFPCLHIIANCNYFACKVRARYEIRLRARYLSLNYQYIGSLSGLADRCRLTGVGRSPLR